VPLSSNAWSAPGGLIAAGESPEQAAIRTLNDASGLTTWAGALETLYLGHNLRGRLVQVFLCRGYYGTGIGTGAQWQTWPPEVTFNAEQGFHRGAGLALLNRAKLQRGRGNLPLTLQMRRPAYECVVLRMQMQARAKIQVHRELTEAESEAMASDLEMVRCYKISMSTAETSLLEMVVGPEGGFLPPTAALVKARSHRDSYVPPAEQEIAEAEEEDSNRAPEGATDED
jgi:ADP-ribose pyrophosphatase YjhB (NUDIX family)